MSEDVVEVFGGERLGHAELIMQDAETPPGIQSCAAASGLSYLGLDWTLGAAAGADAGCADAAGAEGAEAGAEECEPPPPPPVYPPPPPECDSPPPREPPL